MKINTLLLFIGLISLPSIAQNFGYFGRSNVSIGDESRKISNQGTNGYDFTLGGGVGLETGLEYRPWNDIHFYGSIGYQYVTTTSIRKQESLPKSIGANFNRKYFTAGFNFILIESTDSLRSVSWGFGLSHQIPGTFEYSNGYKDYTIDFKSTTGIHLDFKYRWTIKNNIQFETGFRIRKLELESKSSGNLYDIDGTEINFGVVFTLPNHNPKGS